MPDNAATIHRFYGAFAQLDADTLAACYAQDAVFDDEAFSLRGRREIGGMWKMLCSATLTPGLLLGWTPMLRKKVRARAAANLARWMAKNP